MSMDSARKLVGLAVGGIIALCALSASAEAQGGHRIGFVVEMRVNRHARVLADGQQRLVELQQSLNRIMAVERTYRFLTGAEAARAVELDMKGVNRTPEEHQEHLGLRTRNSEMDLEYVRLIGRSTPTAEDTARLRQLQAILDQRSDELEAKELDFNQQIRDAYRALTEDTNAQLVSALEQVAREYQLDVILNTYMPTYNPIGEGTQHEHEFGWESTVLYGGIDVTDKVISIMNGGQAPPPPGEGEPDMSIPGSVKAQ